MGGRAERRHAKCRQAASLLIGMVLPQPLVRHEDRVKGRLALHKQASETPDIMDHWQNKLKPYHIEETYQCGMPTGHLHYKQPVVSLSSSSDWRAFSLLQHPHYMNEGRGCLRHRPASLSSWWLGGTPCICKRSSMATTHMG